MLWNYFLYSNSFVYLLPASIDYKPHLPLLQDRISLMLPPKDSSFAWKFLHTIVTLIFRPWVCRLHIEGRENVPLDGGVIIACNHPGELDVVVLGYASPRQIYFMAKEELFRVHSFLTWWLYRVGAFPVRRGRQDVQAITTSIEIVRQGKALGMFPEGTRDRDRGLTRGRTGAVRIALEVGVPIVPAAVIGVSRLNREWKNPLRRPLVTVRFGKPIRFPAIGKANAETFQVYTDTVMSAIAEMLPPELRGLYGESGQGKPEI
jgi:1-acyl-sn-glycerol-3-phosphate acyltransferase